VTGRVGAVVADKTLVYVKGGAAWMNTTHTLTVPAAGLGGIVGIGGAGISSSTEETAFGWVLGFGAEYAISTNWSAFIEYDYMDFEKKTGALNLTALAGGGAPGTAIANVDFKNKVPVAKIGVTTNSKPSALRPKSRKPRYRPGLFCAYRSWRPTSAFRGESLSPVRNTTVKLG